MLYYISKNTAMDFQEAIEKVTLELQAEGFGVITEINVKETFKKKLDVDFRPYTILGACNPEFAHKALEEDDKIGALLPCNFVVQKTEGGTEVFAMDPAVIMGSVLGDEMEEIGMALSEKIKRVMENL